ncbi:hypothetical protein SAMN06297229_1225 [Pseudidiomarina planktonica]|uniref:KOW motif-containing protein n=1 Tax=Pseudidiomarina planktonica TaxID=1323738 RepID=A0A1Y6ERD3_9GAMM|nr:DUF3912 family protein [Pseudidiomarina planktonica]RUO65374.1 hypothetical protein CWI77_02640 [Pseudidiomarina planktonica]SMQ65265.1 hypothetical protein SAMN06297229_1225 [Pseudidiomarina planktonica]
MSGPTFTYNNPRLQGQTIFVKRGKHQGKLGLVIKVLEDDKYIVSQGDFAVEKVMFDRSEFLVHRYRKIKVPIDKAVGKHPDMV